MSRAFWFLGEHRGTQVCSANNYHYSWIWKGSPRVSLDTYLSTRKSHGAILNWISSTFYGVNATIWIYAFWQLKYVYVNMYVHVPAWVYVLSACRSQKGPEWSVGSSGMGVTGSLKPVCEWWELDPGTLFKGNQCSSSLRIRPDPGPLLNFNTKLPPGEKERDFSWDTQIVDAS